MLVLVANLGSTSFKYKLFRFDGEERVLAAGSTDRIGQGNCAWDVRAGDKNLEGVGDLADHAEAVELHLGKLVELGAIDAITDVDAIGFKAVHGGPIEDAVRVDEKVLATMEDFAEVAPQHNPPYIAAMRAFMQRLPDVPQVAAFETAFHQSIPAARQVYAIPHEWVEDLGIRRYGFHGASHRYIATRMGEIDPSLRRIVSLHLGGSCSVCAIQDGRSVANSFGMTCQTGTFHHSRVGDFDAFAILRLLKAGIDLDTIWKRLGREGGLLGLSGVSGDMREVEEAAAAGNERARLAIDAFVESCRQYLGAFLVALGGADAVVFTGGIGQHGRDVRSAICRDLDFAGIALDEDRNAAADGREESRVERAGGRAQIWVVPTNEELIVARQTVQVLSGQPA